MNVATPSQHPARNAPPPEASWWIDTARFLFPFAIYVVLDLGTRVVARVDRPLLDEPVLIFAAIATRPLLWLLALFGAGVLFWFSRPRLTTRWADLDRGRVLRWLVIPGLVLLTWQGALYDYNFVVNQAHVVDRVLIAGLGIAAVARPIFLVPFAIQSRIVAAQFAVPFDTNFAQNIDQLLVVSLLVIASIHMAYVVTGRNDSSPAIPLLGAAVAAHYFVPGRSKLLSGWVAHNELSNLPLAGHSAGWLANTDGTFAAAASDVLRALGPIGLIGAMLVELGAVVAAFHHRLLRLWLPLAVGFHVVLFTLTGFWFIAWIGLEVTIWVVLGRSEVRDWLDTRWTPARGIAAMALVVVLGAFAFHPPRLTWLDSPVSFGFRITAIGESGMEYNVPPSLFAPSEQELSFVRLSLGPRVPLAGGYGAVGTDPNEYRDLLSLDTFDDVTAMEEQTEPEAVERATDYIAKFARYANTHGRSVWSTVAPPDHFWTNAKEPVFRFDEPLAQIDVFLLTSIHDDGSPSSLLEPVLSLAVDPDGKTRVLPVE